MCVAHESDQQYSKCTSNMTAPVHVTAPVVMIPLLWLYQYNGCTSVVTARSAIWLHQYKWQYYFCDCINVVAAPQYHDYQYTEYTNNMTAPVQVTAPVEW